MDGDALITRLSRLCVQPSGRLPGLALHDHAARAALLIDLGLWGRISRTSEVSFLDTTPTGFPPADRMLTYIDQHPDRTMQQVLAKAPVRMAHALDPTGDLPRAWSLRRQPRIAAHLTTVAMLASALQIVVLTEPETVLGECAEMAWLVKDCVEYLNAVRVRYALVSAAGKVGNGG